MYIYIYRDNLSMCNSGGSKTKLADAAGAKPASQMKDDNCTPLWREAHFQVKIYKTLQRQNAFCSCDVEAVHAAVAQSAFPSHNMQNTKQTMFRPLLEAQMLSFEKVHAVVARSTCRSQSVQSTPCSDHVWMSWASRSELPVTFLYLKWVV